MWLLAIPLVVMVALASAGCFGVQPEPPALMPDAGGHPGIDAGAFWPDAGAAADAGVPPPVMDASVEDAGADGGLQDGAVLDGAVLDAELPDGAVLDGGPDAGPDSGRATFW